MALRHPSNLHVDLNVDVVQVSTLSLPTQPVRITLRCEATDALMSALVLMRPATAKALWMSLGEVIAELRQRGEEI